MIEAGALHGLKILIVEDEFMLAEDLSSLLEDAGATVLGPVGWVDEAVAFIQGHGDQLSAAVVDVNLHGEASYPIADALVACGTPFVFVTGYDLSAMDAAYRGFPRCEKPWRAESIMAALSSARRIN